MNFHDEKLNQMKKIILFCVLVCLSPSVVLAKREQPEKRYRVNWCDAHNRKVEVVLSDGTRCDCLMDTHAIGFYFLAIIGPKPSNKVSITHYKLAKKQELFWY
jgi:hypothetical protein